MDWFFVREIWIALITLTILEIVLGVDNVFFYLIRQATRRSAEVGTSAGAGDRDGDTYRLTAVD